MGGIPLNKKDMKHKLAGVFVFISIFISLTSSPIFAVTPSQTPTPSVINQQMLFKQDVDNLNSKIEKLREDNAQQVISMAKSTIERADRIILWVTSLATLFGVAIAGFSFYVGGDLKRKLTELGGYVQKARKNAVLIEQIASTAKVKGDTLTKDIEDIKNIKKDIQESKGIAKDKIAKIDELVNKAQGTITEIQALNNSASLVSSATLSPSAGTIGNISQVNNMQWLELEKCANCGKTLLGNELFYPQTISALGNPMGISNQKLCMNCFNKQQGQ